MSDENNPYVVEGQPPTMIPSIVCFVDILGFSQLSSEAISKGEGDEFLRRIHKALKKAYDRIREHSEGWDEVDYAIKVFTDNIVIGYPIGRMDPGVYELGNMLWVLSEYQINLAAEGFLVRGGIAYGDHYMDDNIVLGKALLKAYKIENRRGAPPSITVDEKTLTKIHDIWFETYGQKWFQFSDMILEDSDGTFFINYLKETTDFLEEVGLDTDLIQGHQKTIVEGLEKYRNNSAIRPKYEWAARYHNWFCNNPPTVFSSGDDGYDAAIYTEGEKLKDFLIKLEEFAPSSPKRISDFQPKH